MNEGRFSTDAAGVEYPVAKLRAGDRVEVIVPGQVVTGVDGELHVKFDVPNFMSHYLSTLQRYNARVVVTEPFDHPSKDLVGTVRGDDENAWVKVDKYGDSGENFDPPHENYTGIWWNVLDGEERVGDDVAEWPVIGTMPGTPAARAEVQRRYADAVAEPHFTREEPCRPPTNPRPTS